VCAIPWGRVPPGGGDKREARALELGEHTRHRGPRRVALPLPPGPMPRSKGVIHNDALCGFSFLILVKMIKSLLSAARTLPRSNGIIHVCPCFVYMFANDILCAIALSFFKKLKTFLWLMN